MKAPAAKAEASGRGAGGFLSQLDGAGGPQAGAGPAGGAGLLAPPPQPSPAVRSSESLLACGAVLLSFILECPSDRVVCVTCETVTFLETAVPCIEQRKRDREGVCI